MKLFQTKAYKVIVGYIYGWGAAAVIIGALFKILHLPGAGMVLGIGMGVEALIFFVSAFEPPMETYDWSRVFPTLGKNEAEWDDVKGEVQSPLGNIGVQSAPSAPVASGGNHATNIDLGLESSDLEKLKTGINKIAETADNFAGIIGAAPDVAEKIAKASDSFEELGERTQEVGKALENTVKEISSSYEGINKMLVDSAQSLTSQIKENCDKLASGLGSSAESFSSLSQLMEEQLKKVGSQSTDYSTQLVGINKNISALNALYELQINETQSYLETFRGMQNDMGEMLENVSLSLDSTKLFKQESQQLASNVASLNSVYGNMLSVVNNN